ncbi:MAG: right-handed parallel beta-helix repeat-containing protein [Limisphaerales bacterium]
MRLPFFCLIAGMLFATSFAQAQSNLVLLISSPGDYVGQGQTYVTENPDGFSVSGTPAIITINAFGFGFTFAGPGNTPLTTGVYTNSARYPFNGASPGLDISGNGRGCNSECGSFQVLEIHTDVNGQVNRLWITYSNKCECYNAPMTGEIRYNSQLAPPVPSPKTVHVPADYPNIQNAINAASVLTSDTVLVSDGIYNESVNFNGKALLLTSVNGPTKTFINAISFSSGETTNSTLSGFTITNGGVSVSFSSPTIISNSFVNCGTAVNCYFSSPNIIGNIMTGGSGAAVYLGGAGSALIKGNIIQNNGGGIGMNSSGSPTIINNLIQYNNGDAISGVNGCDVNIVQNVIAKNSGSAVSFPVPSGSRGPIAVNNTIVDNTYGISINGYDASSEIINNIIIGNGAVNISYFNSSDIPTFQNNNIFSSTGNAYTGVLTNLTGINGNISTNPFFACLPSGNYSLLAGSPCIDTGTNGAPFLIARDFDGNSRILAGQTNAFAIVDMGAYEFDAASPPSPCLYLNTSNIVVVAAGGQNSAMVTYPTPDATPTATVTCLPASGSVFPAGTNAVVCTLVYGTNILTDTFTVTVLVPPHITNQPSIFSVLANSNATITVGALGTPPVSYQWSFGGFNIPGGTNSTLTVSNAQSINEGYYQATLNNDVGTTTSLPILLRVLPSKALIVSGPFPSTVTAGNQAMFNGDVLGSAPLTFQWYKDGMLLAGAVFSHLIISNAQAATAGTYQLLVSNYLGTVISGGAALTVLPTKPSFTSQPTSMAAVAGTNVTFTSLSVGSDDGLNPIHYSWHFQTNKIIGQSGPNLSLESITAANQGAYFVVATNLYGAATSSIAQLTVYLPPSLQIGLSNIVVDMGKTVVLSTDAIGTPPLNYAWNLNYTPLSNSMASHSLPNISMVQSGFYSVTVTNLYGSISSTGRVSVFLPESQIEAWGDDSGGQTDVPTNIYDAVAVSGGDYHSVAIRHDGTLVAWGFDNAGQIEVPTNSLRFVSVAAGADHNLAITEDGNIHAWGRNDAGQTDIPNIVSSVLDVSAGDSHSLALLASGTVAAWGDNTYGQTNIPLSLMSSYYIYTWWGETFEVVNINWLPVQAIAAGRNDNLALLTNGTVVAWGDNSFGQASPPANLTNVIAIAAGNLHSAALISNGTVVVWGDNTFGQTNVPPSLSNVVAIAAGDYHTLALLSNGTVVGWGDDTFGELNVPSNIDNAIGITSGYYHGLALVPFVPLLQPKLTSSGLVIKWNGTGILQWAPTPTGPYTDIQFQGNVWTNLNMSAPAKFFRLRR